MHNLDVQVSQSTGLNSDLCSLSGLVSLRSVPLTSKKLWGLNRGSEKEIRWFFMTGFRSTAHKSIFGREYPGLMSRMKL
jgi:hypothetical protein